MIKNSLLLLVVLLLAGCTHGPGRNALTGRQDEFDRRLTDAVAEAAGARSPTRDAFDSQALECRAYQRQYFDQLNGARTGEITPMLLRSYEAEYDRELRLLERMAAGL